MTDTPTPTPAPPDPGSLVTAHMAITQAVDELADSAGRLGSDEITDLVALLEGALQDIADVDLHGRYPGDRIIDVEGDPYRLSHRDEDTGDVVYRLAVRTPEGAAEFAVPCDDCWNGDHRGGEHSTAVPGGGAQCPCICNLRPDGT